MVITAAARPGGDRAQFTVSALITGGQPDTAYDLVGNDCSALAPLPDHVWATGLTNAAGAAQLSGYASPPRATTAAARTPSDGAFRCGS